MGWERKLLYVKPQMPRPSPQSDEALRAEVKDKCRGSVAFARRSHTVVCGGEDPARMVSC